MGDKSSRMVDYKTAKEAFVSDNEGTSVWVVSGVSLTSLVSYSCIVSVQTCLGGDEMDWGVERNLELPEYQRAYLGSN